MILLQWVTIPCCKYSETNSNSDQYVPKKAYLKILEYTLVFYIIHKLVVFEVALIGFFFHSWIIDD